MKTEYPCNNGKEPRDCGHCNAEQCPYDRTRKALAEYQRKRNFSKTTEPRE
jgi:hypothetical protein